MDHIDREMLQFKARFDVNYEEARDGWELSEQTDWITKKRWVNLAGCGEEPIYAELKCREGVELLRNERPRRNKDIPEVGSLIDAGCDTQRNPDLHADHNTEVLMQEMAYQGAGGMWRLIMAGPKQVAKPSHLDEEDIAERLRCSERYAARFSAAYESLGLNYTTVRLMENGYYKDGKMTAGIAKAPAAQRRKAIEYLETLVPELEPEKAAVPNFDQEAFDWVEWRLRQLKIGKGSCFKVERGEYINFKGGIDHKRHMDAVRMRYLTIKRRWEEDQQYTGDPVCHAVRLDDETNAATHWRQIAAETEDDLEIMDLAMGTDLATETQTDPCWTGEKLGSEEEGCTHELLTYLRFMGFSGMKTIKRRLSLRKRFVSGRKKDRLRVGWINEYTYVNEYEELGDFRFLTDEQAAQVWTYVNARSRELTNNIQVSASVGHTLDMIRTFGRTPKIKSWALSHMNGKTFNDHGQEIKFSKPTEAESELIFNTLFAAPVR